MFNESLEVQKRERGKINEEYKRAKYGRAYNGRDIGYDVPETVHFRGVDYNVEPAWKLVVDSYDEYLGSVELSHREGLGFSIIKSYQGEPESLDFRFARIQDNIDIKQKENIKDIYLNSANIRNAYFEGNNKCNYHIIINSDLIDFAISLKWFIRNNKTTIDSISFRNVNSKLMTVLIGRICAESGINKIYFTNNEISFDNEPEVLTEEKTNLNKML